MLFTALSQAHAAAFDPGRIIDDSVMTNSSTMTVTQIQAFLNSKVSVCDTTGTLPASDFNRPDLTHAQYAATRGWQGPPYTCLRNFTENGKSSAQIIYDISQQYSINPQVFIVLLQKESSLVTDTWPLDWQYRSATGYGCPDSTPGVCDASYRGFTNQVTWAARLFRNVINQSPTWYSPYIKGSNFIQWSPVASCGGSTINVQNWSTAALYDYTPYQPNSAALNAGYGMGDACSAYGNRNFFLYFNDWFGPTSGLSRDAVVTSSVGTSGWLEFGQSRTVTINVKNTGNDGWCADGYCPAGQAPTRLVAQNYAIFSAYDSTDPSWINGAQVKMQTPSVKPGETGTFVFKVRAPYVNGFATSARFYVNIGGIGISSFAEKANLWIGVHAYPPLSPTLVSQTQQNTTTLLPNQEMAATVTIRNNSQTIWYSDSNLTGDRKPTRLYTPGYTASPFYNKKDSRWLTPSQIAMKTPAVNPGEIAVFEFTLLGPFGAVSSPLKLVPVIDGVSALQDIGISINAITPTPVLSYEFVNASFPPAQTTVGATSSQKATVSVKNISNTVWYGDSSGHTNPTRMVTIFPIYRSSAFYSNTDNAWLAPSQIAMKTPTVNPGEIAVFEFNWKAPSQPGNYLEYFTLVTDGYSFFPMYGSAWRTIVAAQ